MLKKSDYVFTLNYVRNICMDTIEQERQFRADLDAQPNNILKVGQMQNSHGRSATAEHILQTIEIELKRRAEDNG